MPTDLVAQCPQLKHIVFLGTGPASYMNVGELEARGIKVHIIKGYGDTAVAEHSIALMVAAARDVARMDREVRAGTWTPHEGVQLLGKTLGVIGLGGIGREVARIGKGMGMEVIGWNRTQTCRDHACRWSISTRCWRAADVVSMNLTLGDETRGFLSKERIARMKPGVIFVNTARGALADEAALIAALKSGHIRHAGLDVFHAEPLKADHPLAKLPNVTLTAHAAFRTLEASMTLLRRAIDIVKTIVALVDTPACRRHRRRSRCRGCGAPRRSHRNTASAATSSGWPMRRRPLLTQRLGAHLLHGLVLRLGELLRTAARRGRSASAPGWMTLMLMSSRLPSAVRPLAKLAMAALTAPPIRNSGPGVRAAPPTMLTMLPCAALSSGQNNSVSRTAA